MCKGWVNGKSCSYWNRTVPCWFTQTTPKGAPGKGSWAPSPCSGMHRQVHSASCCDFLGGLMHLCVSLQLDLFLSSTDLTCLILQPLHTTFPHIQPCFLRSQWVQNTALLITFLFCLVIGFLYYIALWEQNVTYCLTPDPLSLCRCLS